MERAMRRLLLWGLLLMFAAGCGSDEPVTFDSLSDAERAQLRAVDYAALKALLAEHKGKPVVLAAWSARREDCVEFYRGLSELAARGDPKPVLIALSLDGPADLRRRILPLVREHGKGLVNCVFDDDQMMLLGLVDPAWAGRTPALWLFDAQGKLATSFYGQGALDEASTMLRRP